MAIEAPKTLSLELDVGIDDAISGRVSEGDHRVDFFGWIGLATALESFIERGEGAASKDEGRPPRSSP